MPLLLNTMVTSLLREMVAQTVSTSTLATLIQAQRIQKILLLMFMRSLVMNLTLMV